MSDLDEPPETQGPSDDFAPPTQPPTDDSLLTRAPETRYEPSIPTRIPVDSDPSTELASATSTSPSSPADFPGYTLLETVGEGGMGVVYKARQEGLNRLVALKVILGNRRVGPKDLIRFLAEAEAVASIKHPNVVQVYEYGEAAGRPFLAMEYLPGGTLAERLKQVNRLEPREAAELLAKLARAIHAAHDQGIVHRDLKPANVLFDAEGEPKVTDFGLAKRAKGNDLTQTQAVMGTPAYMSPEQAKGNTKFVGPTADVYALGVVLYECLTGLRPFRDDDTHLLLRQVIEDDPTPLTSHVPGLPRDLELIALKCLAKDPEDRYATAQALAEDLTHFAAGESVSVRAPRRIERTLKWARRKPTQAAAYALSFAVVILTVFGISLAWLWRDAEKAGAAEKKARLIAEHAKTDLDVVTKKIASVEYGRTMQLAYQEWRDNNAIASLALLDGTKPDLRGWEWNYVKRLWHDKLLELKGHFDGGTWVSWSPDGSRISTVSGDNAVRIWDAETGVEAFTIKEYKGFSWSPDGSRIATVGYDDAARIRDAKSGDDARANFLESVVSRDNIARVWDAKTGAQTLTLKGNTGGVTSVCWSPDGSRIATASDDDSTAARVWDAKTGAQTLTLEGHFMRVASVSWSPDGSRIATISRGNTVIVWDAETGVKAFTLEGEFSGVTSVCWSPDGSRIATASQDHMARIWDAKTGDKTLTLKGHTGEVASVRWSPDGSRIATASQDHTARIWNAKTGDETLTLKGHTSGVTMVCWSPDGSRITTVCRDNSVRVWDAERRDETLTLKGNTGGVGSVSWSPDGSRIASASRDATARVWDAKTGAQTLTLKGHTYTVSSVCWSPDGSQIATASYDETTRFWDTKTGAETIRLKGPTSNKRPGQRWMNSGLPSVSWSPDGSRIATVSGDNAVRIWDAETGIEALTLEGDISGVASMSWSPEGSQIAIAIHDEAVRIWDAETGVETLTLSGNTSGVTSVSWSPDGSHIATASYDGTARVWNAKRRAETKGIAPDVVSVMLTLKGHSDKVTSVCWSPDGLRIATASGDSTARVWDAMTGAERLTLKGHTSGVTSVCWSPDGSRIATASDDGTVRIWDSRTRAEQMASGR